MSWTRQDTFLNPKKPLEYAASEPGKIGGVEPSPKTVAVAPEPKVREFGGTDETIKPRDESAKVGDTPKPNATDAEALNAVANRPSNFRQSGASANADAFIEPKNRGPEVVADVVKSGSPQLTEKCAACGSCGDPTHKGSGDFTDCMDRIAPKVNPDDPEAFCAWYEHEQTGRWPGEKRKSGPDVVEA